MKLKLICAGLGLALLLSSCNLFDDAASDIGSDISDMGSDLSSDLSDGMNDESSKEDGNLDNDHQNSDHDGQIFNDDDDQSTTSDSRPESENGDNREESAPTGALPSGRASSDLPQWDLSTLSNEKQGWGQGVQLDEKNRPIGSLTFQEKYGMYDAYFIGEEEPVIYLTFDEGYENGYTSSILDTLKEKNVQAVFFVTLDYIKAEPELIQRMIDEGHIVGNHSDKHPSFPDVSIERCEQEIMNVHNYMLENYNYEMTLFRAPAGEFSERVLAQAQSLGYKTLFWSYAYKDWEVDNQIGADKAYEKVTNAIHPGAIYLLHAVSADNDAILGDFIDCARQQGYEFRLFE